MITVNMEEMQLFQLFFPPETKDTTPKRSSHHFSHYHKTMLLNFIPGEESPLLPHCLTNKHAYFEQCNYKAA